MTAAPIRVLDEPSLLVSDGDETTGARLCDFFNREGYRTYHARSGQEAVEIARDAFLHFLIFEMHLPDFSGVEAFRLITLEKRVIVPCIITSSGPTKEEKLKALSARAFAYMPKPLNYQVLREVAGQILAKFYADEARG